MRRPITWPRYRVSQWIDTSPESMSEPEPTIRYGIQTKRSHSGQWLHCGSNSGLLLYDTEEAAQEMCDQLVARSLSLSSGEVKS